MIKVENLYSEEIINESPYYYDANGRLRVKVIGEASVASAPTPQEATEKKEEPKNVATPAAPTGRKDPESIPVKQKREIGKFKPLPQPVPGARERVSPKAKPQGPNVGMKPGFMPMGMKPEKEIKQDLRDLKNQKREMKMSGQKPGMDLKSKIADAKAKLGAAKGNMKPKGDENLPAVDVKPKAKFLSKFRSQRDTGKNVNTREGLRNPRKLKEDVVNSVFEKLKLVKSTPATDYLEEKLNLKKSSMGDVIKDFKESDAPQFKGKSMAKRRKMAIAAKLQADRG